MWSIKHLWRGLATAAACPACGSELLEADAVRWPVSVLGIESVLCQNCGLVFVARRQPREMQAEGESLGVQAPVPAAVNLADLDRRMTTVVKTSKGVAPRHTLDELDASVAAAAGRED
jgi:hypothetical protein